jgi:hypothetical protein
MDEPSDHGPWEVDEQTRATLPKYLRLMVADAKLDARDRIRAAKVLVEMNGQNAEIHRLRTADDPNNRPAVRLELTADGIAAIRAGLLARLAGDCEPRPAGGAAAAD